MLLFLVSFSILYTIFQKDLFFLDYNCNIYSLIILLLKDFNGRCEMEIRVQYR